MFDKSNEKLILGRYFDALFWHYFVLISLHRRTQMISIDILVPGPSEHTQSWRKTGKNSPHGRRVYKMYWLFAIYSNRRQMYIYSISSAGVAV